MALPLQQLLVRPDLHDAPGVQDHEPVGVPEGGEAVRYREGGPPLHQPADGLLDLFLGLHVHGGGGLVQDQDLRVVEDGAGQGDALALPAGEPGAPLAHLGVVAVGLGHDEGVGVGRLRGLHDLLEAGAGPAVADVLGDGPAEQERLLEHDADLPAQVLEADLPEVHAVDLDDAVVHVVESGDQVHGGGLAHAGLAHQADHLPRRHVEVDLLEHGLALVVAEGDLPEGHPPLRVGHRDRVRVLVGLRGGVDDLEDALGPGEGPRHPGVDLAEPLEGAVEEPHVGVERQEGAQGQVSPDDLLPPEQPDGRHAEAGHQARGGEEDGPVAVRLHAHLLHRGVPSLELLDLAGLLRERLDHADAGQGLIHPRGEFGPGLPPLVEVASHPLPEEDAPGQQEGDGDQDVEGEPPAHVEQEPQDAEEHQAVDHEVGEALHQELLEHAGVPRDAGHDGPDLPLVVELEREEFEAAVEPAADVGGHARAQIGGDPAVHPLRAPAEGADDDEGQDQEAQQGDALVHPGDGPLGHEHVVHDAPRDHRGDQLREGGDDGRGGQEEGAALVGFQVAGDPPQGGQPADAGRADAVLLRQEAAAPLAPGPVEVRVDHERLPLAELLDPARHLGELEGQGAGIGDEEGRPGLSLDLQPPAPDQGLRAGGGDVLDGHVGDAVLAVRRDDQDALLRDDDPLLPEHPGGGEVRIDADQLLLARGDVAMDLLRESVGCGFEEVHDLHPCGCTPLLMNAKKNIR